MIFGVFFGTLLIGIPIGVAIGFTCILISLAVPTVTVSPRVHVPKHGHGA